MGNLFRVRIYSDHAIVGKSELIKPLSKLGVRLLELSEGIAPVKKTRKPRAKKTDAPVKEKKERKPRTKKEAPAAEPVVDATQQDLL